MFVAAFPPQGQARVVATKTTEPPEPGVLAVWPLIEEVC